MRKFILGITIIFFVAFSFIQNERIIAAPIKIQKDTFFKVISPVEISSAISDIGDEVSFTNLYDMYLYETNAVPASSKFYGHIEDLREPVQGTNAQMKIKLDKLVLPDKTTYAINGYIYSSNGNYIGGEMTPPMYYNKTPHYTKGWNNGWDAGILQYTPTNIRYFGEPIIIKAGQELFVTLTDDLLLN